MKDGLTSFDLLAVTAELRTLIGAHVDKVYQREEQVILKVNVPAAGRREVYARSGKWMCLREVPDKPDTPPPFAAALRSHLDNARIERVEQRGFDRIVVLSFDRGTRLIFELFGKGNVVLANDDATLACLHRASFRDRTIAPGVPYDFPPPTANPLAMPTDVFAASAVAAKGTIVKVLASAMNLGGQYAEEVCARAGVEKTTKLSDPDDERLRQIHGVIAALSRQIQESPNPQAILDQGVVVDATPVPLVQHEAFERRPFPSFSEALSFLLDHAPAPPTPSEDRTAKVQRRLRQQELTLSDLREEAVRSGALAELLYAHYAAFEDLIRRAREGTLDVGGTVRAIDPERRFAMVTVGDAAELTIDWTKDVAGNAQRLYEAKKDALAKAEKVLAAIEDTKRELARVVREGGTSEARPRVKATKAFWFEAYRWFVSSEGFLVIGGRDAKTNDAVVKKHLKDGDRYAHADIHGAPSCVVKEGSRSGEATLREACVFALAWSKAWSASRSSGSAFWVNPEQVSKQAESGEYLGRGAWVIRGKRNYVHDLPVRAALGEIVHEGHRKVMAGPEGAVTVRSSKYFLIEPGELGKDTFARRAAHAFAVPAVEVARVLPPGGVRIIEEVGMAAPT